MKRFLIFIGLLVVLTGTTIHSASVSHHLDSEHQSQCIICSQAQQGIGLHSNQTIQIGVLVLVEPFFSESTFVLKPQSTPFFIARAPPLLNS